MSSGTNAEPTGFSGSKVIQNYAGNYLGLTAYETSGSASATIIVYDNSTEGSGPILDVVVIGEGASAPPMNYPQPGRIAENGIYVDVDGAATGSVFS